MSEYAFYVHECTGERLQEYLREAKIVANIVRHTVFVHTTTGIYEVHQDEEEKEKDVEKPKEPEEKPPSGEQGS